MASLLSLDPWETARSPPRSADTRPAASNAAASSTANAEWTPPPTRSASIPHRRPPHARRPCSPDTSRSRCLASKSPSRWSSRGSGVTAWTKPYAVEMVPNVADDQLRGLLVEFVGETVDDTLEVKRRNREEGEIAENVEVVVDEKVDRCVVTRNQRKEKKGIR